MSDTQTRKADHLDLCATDQVAFQGKTTLMEAVHLVHDALPELAIDEIDLSTPFVGRTLRAPVVIAAMTGGVQRAEVVNKDLAQVAEEHGIAFGFGSMRPLLTEGNALGYQVRDVAPNATLFANIGVVQATEASTQALADMVGVTGCDALCVHLNPAQEVVQHGGDTDFRGGLDTIQRLVEDLGVPLIVKETGCGLSRSVGQRLVAAGVQFVDVGGSGGTSWVGVETLRARAATRSLGELFWDWGIPTAASVAQLTDLGLSIVATGGMKHGLDIARALALGATCGGMARPFLMAHNDGGIELASQVAGQVIHEIRIACLLTGASTPAALQEMPVRLGADLARWVPEGSSLDARSRA